ncbi:hypothetical protein [Demequina muriae]|uniref:Uncharacterized protein n=1 Tax=Demequina muriae TaxID=3051664 RepID=A0ABT8GIW4_9MICO|nr:hypothetical protein [Demequina sp. EGI L300058]MDN4481191.1 hypothetical protein [Demequina sp. EGI L300058]
MTSDSRTWTRISLTHLGAWIGGFAAAFAVYIVAVWVGGGTVTFLEIAWTLLWFGPLMVVAAVVLCAIELLLLGAMRKAVGLPLVAKAAIPAVAVYCAGTAMLIGIVTALNPTPEAPPVEEEGPVELAMYADLREHTERFHTRDLSGAYVASAALATVPAAAVFVSHFVFFRRIRSERH